jgi:hypothetical protein
MTDHQRDILREVHEQMEEKKGLVWGPEWMEEVAAALRAMLAENDALKAELARLTADRDEARRWYCRSTAQREYTIYLPSANEIDKTARSVAIRFGWDCFEGEVKP